MHAGLSLPLQGAMYVFKLAVELSYCYCCRLSKKGKID
jgi:hypothetical protein